MPGPRAVQNLQMPHPRDWQGGQMPHSSPGGGGQGAGRIDWCIRRSTFKFGFLTYTKALLPVVSTDFPQLVHVKSWKNLAFTIDLICKINFVCTSTLIEKTLKENQFVGESKYPTASLIFAQLHSPKTERMKKELILTACISSFDETTRNDRKSCPAQRGIAFASMTLLDTRIGSRWGGGGGGGGGGLPPPPPPNKPWWLFSIKLE